MSAMLEFFFWNLRVLSQHLSERAWFTLTLGLAFVIPLAGLWVGWWGMTVGLILLAVSTVCTALRLQRAAVTVWQASALFLAVFGPMLLKDAFPALVPTTVAWRLSMGSALALTALLLTMVVRGLYVDAYEEQFPDEVARRTEESA